MKIWHIQGLFCNNSDCNTFQRYTDCTVFVNFFSLFSENTLFIQLVKWLLIDAIEENRWLPIYLFHSFIISFFYNHNTCNSLTLFIQQLILQQFIIQLQACKDPAVHNHNLPSVDIYLWSSFPCLPSLANQGLTLPFHLF